ncbi:MAG: hypothetical protein KDC37_00285 [Flavobacteriales bacterium]|nr:hypothetical protein [Flavobacteriales bacterium]
MSLGVSTTFAHLLMSIRITGFIRLPKHRQFAYRPRIYSPEKEFLDTRKRLVLAHTDAGTNGLKQAFGAAWRRGQRSSQNRTSVLRIALIAAILGFGCFYFLFS